MTLNRNADLVNAGIDIVDLKPAFVIAAHFVAWDRIGIAIHAEAGIPQSNALGVNRLTRDDSTPSVVEDEDNRRLAFTAEQWRPG